MVAASKLLPELHKTADCADIFHPWSRKCTTGAAIMGLDSLWTCSKFYAVLYLVS